MTDFNTITDEDGEKAVKLSKPVEAGSLLRVLVVDDEKVGRTRLTRLLGQLGSIRVVGECATAGEALDFLSRESCDVVLLDIEMPGENGLELARRLQDNGFPPAIFVTAHGHYAVKAFDLNAIDYVLKPVSSARLADAIHRVRERLRNRDATVLWQRQLEGLTAALKTLSTDDNRNAAKSTNYLLRFPIRTDSGTKLLKVGDVDWIEASRNYVKLHVGKSLSYTIRESLDSLEQKLDPKLFARTHRSIIVNLERVKELQPWFRGDYVLIMADGSTHKLSRWYRERVRNQLLHGTAAPSGEPEEEA